MLAAHFHEGFVGALHDALAADINPGTGGHLPVHHQAQAIEFGEMLPIGPVRHQVAVGDQHARRVFMRGKHAHRLARLHQQSLVVAQIGQRFDDAVKTVPVARGAANAAIHHQFLGPLGNIRVQVVHQHAPTAPRSATTAP